MSKESSSAEGPATLSPPIHSEQLRQHDVEGKSDNDEDEANIAKALRFWKHPSLRDIPMEQKQQYLYEKGVTDAQIHKAWDRILEEKPAVEEDPGQQQQQQHLASTNASPVSNPPPPPVPIAPANNLQPQHPASSTNPYLNPPLQYPPQDPYRTTNSAPYSSPYPPRYEEEDGPGPFLQGVSLVALGGFVGLTAAAAARWLNGGDFQLLPPPALQEEEMKQQQQQQQQHQRLILRNRRAEDRGSYDDDEVVVDDEDEIGGNEDEDDEDQIEYTTDEEEMDESHSVPEAQEKLLQEVQSISESMKAHVSLQEKILQKLSSQGTSITNHSMELLRASSAVSRSDDEPRRASDGLLLWAQLLEIKSELRELRNLQGQSGNSNGNMKDWESQLEALLSKLEECVDSIQSSCASHPSKTKSLPVPVPSPSTHSPPKPAEALSFSTSPVKLPGEPALNEKGIDSIVPSTGTLTLRQAVRKMAQENDATTLRVGSQLLYLYIINLTGNPRNPRYRKIFTTNESFQKVEAVSGGKDLLFAVGFEERQGCLEWLASNSSPDAEGLAIAKLQEAAAALGILKSGNPSADLTQSALAAVAPDPDVQLLAPPAPPPTTPDGSSLISPPQPKKMPFVHLASEDEAKTEGDENDLSEIGSS